MRDAFALAVAQLSLDQVRIFEEATAQSIGTLVRDVLALDDATIRRVLDLGRSELGNLYPHPLNAKGLHVLKWLVARDVVDRRREANGWASHAQHDEFDRHGLLTRKLTHWRPGMQHAVPLTLEEADLIGLATGWAQRPYGCSATQLHDGDAAAKSGLFAEGFREHIFTDGDDQYQLHVDVYMPTVKFMVFAEPTRIETGPFNFVMGSHRTSTSKARWLFERTRQLTRLGQRVGAFRHVNTSAEEQPGGWCSKTRSCLEAAYAWQQHDLAERFGFPRPTPMIVEAGTLVVADTSAFHFRGLGPAGGRRARMANLVYRCRSQHSSLTSIASVTRVPVLACANGSQVSDACGVFHPARKLRTTAKVAADEPSPPRALPESLRGNPVPDQTSSSAAFTKRGGGARAQARAADVSAATSCIPRAPDAVAARVQEVYRVLRNDARCSGPVGLLADVPTHRADGTRVPRRECDASVAETLGWRSVSWDAEREEAYHRLSTEPLRRSVVLTIGNITFPAQHFWDAIIFDLFFNGAPRRPRRFFEAGARDGYSESNSLFFEKYLGFTGVLVEPTPLAKCNTRRNRPLATVVRGAFCAPGTHLDIPTNASFFMASHPIPDDCPLSPDDWRAPCYSWRGLAAEHDLNRVDLWSLDIDNDKQQHMILQSIDWDRFDPVAMVVECKQRKGCETLLQERGYHTLVLENNQKHTYYGDVLAWKDTCRAWRKA